MPFHENVRTLHLKESLRTDSITLLAGLQWLGFMFANTIVIPLSVGTAFHNTPGEISGSMARSFLLTGLACLLQACCGHRLPLMEGQSGLWWGVILGLVSMGSTAKIPLSTVGGSLAVGVMAGGLLVSLLGGLGWHRGLNRLFTPVVMAVLLFLLSAQLIDLFFQGMTGISQTGRMNLPMAGLSLALVLLVSTLTIGPKGLVSNFAILIGLGVGWAIYE
ncbi:uracil/xanthine transporter, partial [Alicyclobacillaceae bacterium I2511]